MSSPLVPFLIGGIATMCAVAGLFFLRFYFENRDRLFLFFAAAFWIEGIDRAILAFSHNPREADPVLYLIRASAYIIILVGIIDKNRRG